MAPVSENPALAALWTNLRSRLLHPPDNLSGKNNSSNPVFIPHRPIKDLLRSIPWYPPAARYFGLYAFDLLNIIYQEALSK